MTKYIWYFLLSMLLLMLLGYFLCTKFLCAAAAPVVPVAKDTCGSWDVDDGNKDLFDIDNNVNFKRSSYRHLTNIPSVNNAMDKVANYLKSNKDRALTITGLYSSQEKNPHNLLPNLGLARADDVKSWLESKAVPSNQIDIVHKVVDNACYRGDTLRRGVEFAFGKAEANNSRIGAIKDRLLGKPLMLYFNTGSDVPNITTQLRQDFADLFYYLDRVPGAKIDIDGHTDNVGALQGNITLSQNRANDVKNYIMTNGGVAAGRMDTNGFGPNKPIAANDTPENKAKNRRVEVTLK